jgi:molecular chaperone GrpE
LNSEEQHRDPERDPPHDPEPEDVQDPMDPTGPADPREESEETDPYPDEGPENILDLDALAEEDPGMVGDKLAVVAEELELTRRERDEYLDTLRRLKAEFENSRKRQEREHARLLQTASERLVRELLPVLDNLERALEAEGDIREGVRATRDQLADVLGREGLLPVASDGQAFDPNVHEAVMGQPSEEHEEGTILQTFERGYVLNGKPIRPAKVVVARQV